MKYAPIEEAGRETGDVLLILSNKECCTLVVAIEAAAAAQPRKTSFKRLAKLLADHIPY